MIVVDGLRKMRNVNEYAGDPIPAAALASCLGEAEALLDLTAQRLREHRADLMA